MPAEQTLAQSSREPGSTAGLQPDFSSAYPSIRCASQGHNRRRAGSCNQVEVKKSRLGIIGQVYDGCSPRADLGSRNSMRLSPRLTAVTHRTQRIDFEPGAPSVRPRPNNGPADSPRHARRPRIVSAMTRQGSEPVHCGKSRPVVPSWRVGALSPIPIRPHHDLLKGDHHVRTRFRPS